MGREETTVREPEAPRVPSTGNMPEEREEVQRQGSHRALPNVPVLGLPSETLVFSFSPQTWISAREGTSPTQPKQKKGDPYRQSLLIFSFSPDWS